MKRFFLKGLVFLCLLTAVSDAAASNLVTKSYNRHRSHFNFKLGVINGGTVRFDNQSFETNIGLSGGVGFDFTVGNRMFLGVMIDMHDIQFFEEREAMLNVSLAVKPVIYKHKKKVAYKPNIAVGIADLGGIGILKHTQYMTIKAAFEVVFFAESKYVWMGEIALWGSPYCFNDEHDITLGPFIQARFGIMFMN